MLSDERSWKCFLKYQLSLKNFNSLKFCSIQCKRPTLRLFGFLGKGHFIHLKAMAAIEATSDMMLSLFQSGLFLVIVAMEWGLRGSIRHNRTALLLLFR